MAKQGEKEEAKHDAQPEAQQEEKKEIKREAKSDAKKAAKPAAVKEATEGAQEEAKPETKKAVKREAKKEAKPEAPKEVKLQAPKEAKPEVKKEAKQAAQKEVKSETIKEANPDYTPRLIEMYTKEVIPFMQKRFNYKNIMQVPRLEKIVLNIGVGEATENAKNLDSAVDELTKIAGQKPVIRRAKKAISNFKLRAGMPIGCSTTLRKWRMYEFLDRLISIAIPRVRDFRGLLVKFDGRGNYNMSIKEQIVFPEIDYDKVEKIRGFNITFVTTAKTDEEAHELLSAFGLPFVKRN
jgi:large subunit ribosomal protein L5